MGCVTAHVQMVQHYVNTTQDILEIVYIFPIDKKSAVCDFAVAVDGRILRVSFLFRIRVRWNGCRLMSDGYI